VFTIFHEQNITVIDAVINSDTKIPQKYTIYSK